MKKISINEKNFLEYRDTPWDERIFGIKTKEILYICYTNEKNISNLLDKLEEQFDNDGFIYSRQNSNDNLLKKHFIEKGFYLAETAINLTLSKVQKHNFLTSYKNNLKVIEKKLIKNEISEIKKIAKTSFRYSRFHEDPFIDINLSNLRYENWIDDLIKQNKPVLIYKNSEEKILSFMFYSCKDSKVDLILGGSKKEFGVLTASFFSSVMTYLQNNGIKKVDVMISASNIIIFNIYINLNFSIKKTFFDYHKFINRKMK